MTLSRARRVVLAFVVMVSTSGSAITPVKGVDMGAGAQPDQKFRCRPKNLQSVVTLAFEGSKGSCTLNLQSRAALLRTLRSSHAHFELCNACEDEIDVTLDVGQWSPLSGPWFESCIADSVNLNEERVSRKVPSKKRRHIICDIMDKDPGRGLTAARYSVQIVVAGKTPVVINSPSIKVEDN
jgi:hypothetical protein